MPTRIFHKNTSHERLSPFHNGDNQHVNQARRQDLAAGGPKTRRGLTFLKCGIGCMEQPGAKREMEGNSLQMGDRAPLAPRWRRP